MFIFTVLHLDDNKINLVPIPQKNLFIKLIQLHWNKSNVNTYFSYQTHIQ